MKKLFLFLILVTPLLFGCQNSELARNQNEMLSHDSNTNDLVSSSEDTTVIDEDSEKSNSNKSVFLAKYSEVNGSINYYIWDYYNDKIREQSSFDPVDKISGYNDSTTHGANNVVQYNYKDKSVYYYTAIPEPAPGVTNRINKDGTTFSRIYKYSNKEHVVVFEYDESSFSRWIVNPFRNTVLVNYFYNNYYVISEINLETFEITEVSKVNNIGRDYGKLALSVDGDYLYQTYLENNKLILKRINLTNLDSENITIKDEYVFFFDTYVSPNNNYYAYYDDGKLTIYDLINDKVIPSLKFDVNNHGLLWVDNGEKLIYFPKPSNSIALYDIVNEENYNLDISGHAILTDFDDSVFYINSNKLHSYNIKTKNIRTISDNIFIDLYGLSYLGIDTFEYVN